MPPQPAPPRRGVPPASSRILESLPEVVITADDLIEEGNRECSICLEEQCIGRKGCKLPCGHLYHRLCLRDWLTKHCTCPVCRFELPTDDRDFEEERKQRMKSRRVRYRLDELKNKSVAQLRELSANLGVKLSNCVDKMDIIDLLVSSKRVDVTEGVPTLEFSREEFMAKGVQELRELLLSFGISDVGAIEKSDLRNRLVESGRVIVLLGHAERSNISGEEFGNYGNASPPSFSPYSSYPYSSSSASSSSGANYNYQDQDYEQANAETRREAMQDSEHGSIPQENGAKRKIPSPDPLTDQLQQQQQQRREHLSTLTVRQLHTLAASLSLSTAHCIYKQDLVDVIAASAASATTTTATTVAPKTPTPKSTPSRIITSTPTPTSSSTSTPISTPASGFQHPSTQPSERARHTPSPTSTSTSTSTQTSAPTSTSTSASSVGVGDREGTAGTEQRRGESDRLQDEEEERTRKSKQQEKHPPSGFSNSFSYSYGGGSGGEGRGGKGGASDSRGQHPSCDDRGAGGFNYNFNASASVGGERGFSFSSSSSSSNNNNNTHNNSGGGESRMDTGTLSDTHRDAMDSGDVLHIDLQVLTSMSIRELMSITEAYGICIDGCIEKEDILLRMRHSSKIIVSL